MNKSKITRLMLGLVILFSFFIFQGSQDEHGCAQCEDPELGGELIVINQVTYPNTVRLAVKVIPNSGGKIIYPGKSVSFYLDKGTYQVIATSVDYKSYPVEVKSVNMITMDTFSIKTIVVK